MTCIIGVECKDGIVIAGDYLGSNGFTKSLVTQSKIFEHSDILYGYCGSFRYGQLLEICLDNNHLYKPTINDTYSWLIRSFIPELKAVLKEHDCAPSSGSAVIGINGQMWELQCDLSVLRSPDGIVSVGSGNFHAISSMKTMLKLHNKPLTTSKAIEMLDLAYDVIAETNCGVSREFNHIIKFL